MENDPGSSQGSGVAYEAPSENSSQNTSEPPLEEKKLAPEESTESVLPEHQIALSSVVLEFRAKKKEPESGSSVGLSVKYSASDSVAKGLLLNKKA